MWFSSFTIKFLSLVLKSISCTIKFLNLLI
ncbi:hypothetical protein KSS87_007938 [Heliosperma pusillum]|nr:hypothetical protein KSS87_007938 [Heliosperma pusillum]